jgi:hypothetical protein
MKVSRNFLLSGIVSVLIFLFSLLSFGNAQSESTIVFENVVIEKLGEETLTFLADKDKRIVKIKGHISQDGQTLSFEGLTPGSLCNIEMEYPSQREGLPVLKKIKRVDGNMPQ